MSPAARQKRPVADGTFLNFQFCSVSDGASETATPERAAVNAVSYPLWPFLPFQPATMSLVGCRKRWGRKGALGYVWCLLHLILGNNRISQNSSRTNTPHRSLTTRRPSFRNQVWQQLRFHYCGKSVLQLKFVMQYGFALGFQVTRERSKKTKAVSAMQTQPAVCIARGGTKRQNKKSCCARLRFVSFDSDEGPGEIGIPWPSFSFLNIFFFDGTKKKMLKDASPFTNVR